MVEFEMAIRSMLLWESPLLVPLQTTCTITNDDDPARLKLVKLVDNTDGGEKVPADWTLKATADNPDNSSRDYSQLGNYAGDYLPVFANIDYNLTESFVANYTAGNWSCVDDVTTDPVTDLLQTTQQETGAVLMM
jgi:hypothetical protein